MEPAEPTAQPGEQAPRAAALMLPVQGILPGEPSQACCASASVEAGEGQGEQRRLTPTPGGSPARRKLWLDTPAGAAAHFPTAFPVQSFCSRVDRQYHYIFVLVRGASCCCLKAAWAETAGVVSKGQRRAIGKVPAGLPAPLLLRLPLSLCCPAGPSCSSRSTLPAPPDTSHCRLAVCLRRRRAGCIPVAGPCRPAPPGSGSKCQLRSLAGAARRAAARRQLRP